VTIGNLLTVANVVEMMWTTGRLCAIEQPEPVRNCSRVGTIRGPHPSCDSLFTAPREPGRNEQRRHLGVVVADRHLHLVERQRVDPRERSIPHPRKHRLRCAWTDDRIAPPAAAPIGEDDRGDRFGAIQPEHLTDLVRPSRLPPPPLEIGGLPQTGRLVSQPDTLKQPRDQPQVLEPRGLVLPYRHTRSLRRAG
jgi:hypothetical protein